VACYGISRYLIKDATAATFCEVAALAPKSALAMIGILPKGRADPEARPDREYAERRGRVCAIPFICRFAGPEIVVSRHGAGSATARGSNRAGLVRTHLFTTDVERFRACRNMPLKSA
jgi:hypothetical protein